VVKEQSTEDADVRCEVEGVHEVHVPHEVSPVVAVAECGQRAETKNTYVDCGLEGVHDVCPVVAMAAFAQKQRKRTQMCIIWGA
jgi:hypothetical protein